MFSEEIPVIIAIKALGLVQDKEIAECIGSEYFSMIAPSFGECISKGVVTNKQALFYMSNYIKLRPENNRIEEVRTIISEKVLPNVKTVECGLRKKGISYGEEADSD
mgnify:CR=1 FL=1